jgi:hypothetical protein
MGSARDGKFARASAREGGEVMSLLFSRRRALRAMERDLAASDPALVGLFTIFTRLERDERQPGAGPVIPSPVPPGSRPARAAQRQALPPGYGWTWWTFWPGWDAL